ncbi:hypothetical protein [Prescottella equi]|uniref:hypothetical protein n=1 Tax=Rhodococcus hoagii TaxID=43767 RepID=UPI0015848EDD|nr:hypothetical protein [Prescottella equi]
MIADHFRELLRFVQMQQNLRVIPHTQPQPNHWLTDCVRVMLGGPLRVDPPRCS